jgi:glycosyl transferase family 87
MPGRGELTPAQHAFIRRQLALIPVYIWLVYSWVQVLGRIANDEKDRDIVHFYVQGLIASRHDAPALYDMEKMADIAQRVLPSGRRALYPPVYGPQVSLLFMPLSRFSYVGARNVWLAVTVLIYGVCMYAIWRACPRLRDRAGLAALLLIAAPPFHFLLGFVQISALALVCVTCGFFALRANRPFLAGLALGSLFYKPPLMIGIAVVLGCRALERDGAAERRIVLGAVAAAALQLAVGAWYWGPSILPQYVLALTRVPDVAQGMEPYRYHMHSWRTFFDLFGLPGKVAFAAYAIAALATCIVAFLSWRARGPLALRYSALLIATVLVDPHLYGYDLIILVPALLLLWDWQRAQSERPVVDVLPWMPFERIRRLSFPTAFQWFLYVCYFAPLFSTTLADIAKVQVSVPIIATLGVIILSLLHAEPGTSNQEPGTVNPRTLEPANP